LRLLIQRFKPMMAGTVKKHKPRAAPLWRLTVETWLRRQPLIFRRQNQNH